MTDHDMAWVEHDYADAEELASMLAFSLKSVCVDAVAERGHALLAFAGGRTPLPVYARLAARPFDWPKVVVMPTDERCVPHDHSACNLRALRETLAGAEGLVLESLTTPDGDPERSVPFAAQTLARHAQPFDTVLLGMGNDGHTASLFPGTRNIDAAMNPASRADVCRIDPEPLPLEAPFPRITLTLQRLLRARCVHLLVTGMEKRAVLRHAQAVNDPQQHPVAALLHAPDVVTHIYWSP